MYTEIIDLITTVVGLVTVILAFREYKKSNTQKRLELYIEYRRKLKEEVRFKEIIAGLDDDSSDLKNVSYIDKNYFLGFYEDIAILLENKLMSSEIVCYMFGYYAIKCLDSKNFWDGIEKDSYYWSLFVKFAKEMKRKEEEIEKRRNRKPFSLRI